jgi:hypothetical protein
MSAASTARLDTLSLGFREHFLSYDELTQQVRAWADAFPDLCRAASIGRSPEGRELWLLTLGPDPDRPRPSAWADGNMHASELCGSSVALAVAEDILRLHLLQDGDAPSPASSMLAAARVREVRFYILPRMSPDGAEAFYQRPLRALGSRDARPARPRVLALRRRRWRWARTADADARHGRRDGRVGDFPGLLPPRTIDDSPPYYKVYPEGVIENFDGKNVPTLHFLSDSQTD